MILLLIISVAFAKSPGDCCRMNWSFFGSADCNKCPHGYESSVGDWSTACGWANVGVLVTIGRCKFPARRGSGKLAEGECCAAHGALKLVPGFVCKEDCEWGYTNEFVDTTSKCTLGNIVSVGLVTFGTCNKKPEFDAMNDAYLTVRLMNMAIKKQYSSLGESGENDKKEWDANYNALRDLGYKLGSYEIDDESFHVIQAGRTLSFDEHGASVIYFLGEHGGNTELVIAFPGSKTFHDWTHTNVKLAVHGSEDTKCFDAEGDRFCGGKTVIEHYETMRTKLLQEIEQLLNKQCVKSCVDVIRVLGHSLGGSAAQFGAIDMAKKFAGRYKVWLSTYASVRALDPDSSNKAQSLFTRNGNRAMRFMIRGDIVPWAGVGLRHFGNAYFINNGALTLESRDYMPTDTKSDLCCPLCSSTNDVMAAFATPTAVACIIGNHRVSQYIDHINPIQNINRRFLDNGRVPARPVTRHCPTFPPRCVAGGRRDSGFKLVRPNVECNNNSKESKMGEFRTVEECAEACRQRIGCTNFIYGKGNKAGKCYDEGVTEEECTEWQTDDYDFYKLDDGQVFSQVAAFGTCLKTVADIGTVLGNLPHTIQVRLTFPDSYPSTRQWILNLGQRATGAQHWIWQSQNRVQFGSWGVGQIHAVDISKCTYLTTTFSGSVLKLYCDGVFMAQKNMQLSINSAELNIGRIGFDDDFAGCISEVSIFSYERSADEVERADLPDMKYLGSGYCTSGYYAGWDGKGIASAHDCKQVCLSEQQCTYAAFVRGKTCSRYNGVSCTLNSDRAHITFAKRSQTRRSLFDIFESHKNLPSREALRKF